MIHGPVDEGSLDWSHAAWDTENQCFMWLAVTFKLYRRLKTEMRRSLSREGSAAHKLQEGIPEALHI